MEGGGSHQIIITGNRLGLGPALANSLVSNKTHDIILISNPYSPVHVNDLVSDEIQLIPGELLDFPFLTELIGSSCPTIYHTDIMVSLDPRTSHYVHQHNVVGTENLINAALCNQIKRLVYVGSSLSQRQINRDLLPICNSLFQADKEIYRGAEEGLQIEPYYPGFLSLPNGDSLPSKTYYGSGRFKISPMLTLVDAISHGQGLPWEEESWDSAPRSIRFENDLLVDQLNENGGWRRLINSLKKWTTGGASQSQFFSADFT